MRTKILCGLAVLLYLCIINAPQASAQSIVFGDGKANMCYLSVKHGNSGHKTAIRNCKLALKSPNLLPRDEASTHVNLGILLMRAKKYGAAASQYKIAINMRPNLSEAYINLAANMIFQGKYQEALVASNKGIGLKTKKMPEALYNRAMANDNLGHYDAAYRDLKQALTLRPDWAPALRALDNYEVVTKSG